MTNASKRTPNPAKIIPTIVTPVASSLGYNNPPPKMRAPTAIRNKGKRIETAIVTSWATLLIIHTITYARIIVIKRKMTINAIRSGKKGRVKGTKTENPLDKESK
jgi:hypothetical protein